MATNSNRHENGRFPASVTPARFEINRHTMPSNSPRNSLKTKETDTNYSTHFFRVPRAHLAPKNASKLDARSQESSRYARKPGAPARYNGSVPIQLIAMDIDGTLLDSHAQLPDENLRAVTEAAAAGIEIVIVTGRRFEFARSVADALPCDLHLIVNNGAVIKSKSGETHQRLLLDADIARQLLDATGEYRNEATVFFDRPHGKQVILERVDWDDPLRGGYFRRNREFIGEVEPLTACLDGEDPIQVMYVGACERIREARKIVEALPIADEFTVAITEYEHRNLSMLDVLRRGVNKGAALAEWAGRRGIQRENVMAIGDNWNDREMLEYAGLPVVMGNSVPELKTLGWSVTLSNDECGLAEAIHRHALRDRKTGGIR